jgi:type VI secretion system secreted protein VgrG
MHSLVSNFQKPALISRFLYFLRTHIRAKPDVILLAGLLAFSPLSSAKPSPSPIEHGTSCYVFNSFGQPASVLVSGYAGSIDDERPVRRNAVRPHGMATPYGGKNAPQLESYLPQAPYGVGNRAAAQRQAELQQQALEARHERYMARGTVRSLRAGGHFSLTQAPLAVVNDPQHAGLNVLAVSHLGINNLPKPAQQGIAELLGEVPQLLLGLLQGLHATQAISPIENSTSSYHNGSDHHGSGHLNPSGPLPLELGALLAQAQALGYANQCELITASVPWRPLLQGAAGGGTGARLLANATASGAQSAWVVGPNGLPDDTSAGDLYTDALGRVRIRLTWQGSLGDADGATSGQASCWVRVAQRSAGSGMGLQFLPRVGQEVLVQFLGGDADRPIVVGALYNGQGEGGVLPTPAGAVAGGGANSPSSNPFAAALDSRSSGQGNLMAGGTGVDVSGHSPAWFGSVHGKHGESEGAASAGGHANSAAQWGIRTQEWGSSGSGSTGYNQLVFDDNDTGGGNQQRIHLKTSQYASELSLGHLVHTADNYRGALRGQGFELRTDAYGAIRAGSGLHLSTYPIRHSASARDPAGDNSAALSLLKQAKVLSEAFSQAAGTHATVKLASFEGSTEPTKSAIDDKASPLPALYQASATQVSTQGLAAAYADAPEKRTTPDASKLPHSGEPILTLAGKGGIALVAGQSLQWSNSETVSLMSGQDSQSITGGQFRVHSGQAIGVLAGAVGVGEEGKGLTLIAGKDPVRYEAQSNAIQIQAKQLINIQSANAHIDWAAAKKISLSTADGANITIEGGNITIQCPGQLTVHAASKTFDGPAEMSYKLPIMPRNVCIECLAKRAAQRAAFVNKGA